MPDESTGERPDTVSVKEATEPPAGVLMGANDPTMGDE
jgi:hypothetical protein